MYIEAYYKHVHIHSTLDYLAPERGMLHFVKFVRLVFLKRRQMFEKSNKSKLSSSTCSKIPYSPNLKKSIGGAPAVSA
jgi:hypothetical protein